MQGLLRAVAADADIEELRAVAADADAEELRAVAADADAEELRALMVVVLSMSPRRTRRCTIARDKPGRVLTDTNGGPEGTPSSGFKRARL